MSQKLQKLLGEFTAIVVGVLVALAVDQWMEDRDDVALEREYAERLIRDLRIDSARYDDLLTGPFVAKRRFLTALVDAAVQEQLPSSGRGIMSRLDQSTWGGVVEVQDAAFREMESTGRIGLLRAPELRSDLANYYANHRFLSERYFRSPGAYDRIVAEAVPGMTRAAYHAGDSIALSDAALALESLRRHPDLLPAANAELAYLGGLIQWYNDLQRRSVDLMTRLQNEYPGSGSS